MSLFLRFALLAFALAASAAGEARAERKTVCTITINSDDERETLRRNLPEDEYRFVELVERGHPDWFASACRSGLHCDVLVVSGHFDDGTEFYSDRPGARESLPVATLEQAACSASCSGLFAGLKEVYLFGCNTLEPAPSRLASAEIARSLVRSGHSAADADRLSRELAELHAESNRDRMRHIFKDVPVIYGFSAKAPLGARAGPALERYFRSGPDDSFGTGRTSARLLATLAPASLTATRGVSDSDPDAGVRGDMCQLVDEAPGSAHRIEFVHRLLGREMAEVRMLLDRVEAAVASLSEADRARPEVSTALAEIARDADARARYLAFARDADEASTRARMTRLAGALGWLSPAEVRAELQSMFAARLAANDLGVADVDLACSLNEDGSLDLASGRAVAGHVPPSNVASAAVLACLGDAAARPRVLHALAAGDGPEVAIAQTYLRHRPIADAAELREVAAAVLHMKMAEAQARALDALSGYRFSDPETLLGLTELFALARSIDVQRAVAGVLIRSDYRAISTPALARKLQAQRLKSPDGADVIDVLIRRLAS
ncbi:MAG TPA: hypothetical protein VMN79_05975 [Casimicrobiaceae bacterium]|nr:hypothetical protein [Casimicrobiaceae bacterium]